MSIKENIKNELLKMIAEENSNLENRRNLNDACNQDNYDVSCEENFIEKLSKFVNSI